VKSEGNFFKLLKFNDDLLSKIKQKRQGNWDKAIINNNKAIVSILYRFRSTYVEVPNTSKLFEYLFARLHACDA
jgi:hypothetical protein